MGKGWASCCSERDAKVVSVTASLDRVSSPACTGGAGCKRLPEAKACSKLEAFC